MRTVHLLAPAALLAFIGCSGSLYFYPVRGPLAAQQPVPVITAKATGLASGSISLLLPSGEKCQGPWAPVPQGQVDNELSSTWNSVYGPGNYEARVLGSKWHGKAILTGNQGSKIQLEFFRDTVKDAPLQGVARDNAGNVYKITQ